MSDLGSDDNDCQTADTPCKNLQTVLDRASDGTVVYVTSDTLSLDNNTGVEWVPAYPFYNSQGCIVMSSISYALSSLHNAGFTPTCTGKWEEPMERF